MNSTGNASSSKRSRAPIACERCKRRKTKCNGMRPVCAPCQKARASCTWVGLTRVGGHISEDYVNLLEYTRGLESKLAELEHRAQGNTTAQVPDDQITSTYSVTAELSTNMALLSMNAAAEPFFVGATAGFSLSKVVEGILSQASIPDLVLASVSSSTAHVDDERGLPESNLNKYNPQLERKLVEIFFGRVHPRYPFLDERCFTEFYRWYQSSINASTSSQSKLFQLHMVFAIGARIMQLHPEMGGSISPEFYYSNATQYIDGALQVPGLERIQSLLLLALYVLRTPSSTSNLGSWHIIGIAVRYAVELGMHRNIRSRVPGAEDLYRVEMRRRVFWSAYVLDRAVSLTLGRPFALSESDIDVDLPVGLEYSTAPGETIYCFQESQPDGTDPVYTKSNTRNLSSFVHLCRLRRLESRIKQELYSVSTSPTTQGHSYDTTVESLRHQLDEWLNSVPSHLSPDGQSQEDYSLYDTPEFFRIQYSKALRMLLQHRITHLATSETDPSKDKEYLTLSARAAGDICQYYKTLHQRRPLGWNLLALHSIFTAGLTLLYCIWADKEHPTLGRFEDIRACSNVLFAISERWSTATRFRDIFEILAKRMIHLVSLPSNPLAELGDTSFVTEEKNLPTGALPEPTGFDSMNQEDFWAMLDELVDDDYIRSQFRLNEVEGAWGL
ncbi:Zn(II)2Cys6 transcription factor [Aspergillus alliaceus]|uniref:Zn(II)2Cys6 transcription factor n=1 Tax=Petromyces alliaceus TaxID=209559 RepID=UPI0012A6265E|nr:fungal-specific transcription factor domain-containing protein [Aspergillus alliaceus]KAB8230370.1 fungal-specific transcription factor domain-containing protein [Aspergillus alliaceus]